MIFDFFSPGTHIAKMHGDRSGAAGGDKVSQQIWKLKGRGTPLFPRFILIPHSFILTPTFFLLQVPGGIYGCHRSQFASFIHFFLLCKHLGKFMWPSHVKKSRKRGIIRKGQREGQREGQRQYQRDAGGPKLWFACNPQSWPRGGKCAPPEPLGGTIPSEHCNPLKDKDGVQMQVAVSGGAGVEKANGRAKESQGMFGGTAFKYGNIEAKGNKSC